MTKQTFATLTDVNTGSYTYKLTPVNIGWVGEATSTTGYSPYYQWGRKDAIIPSAGIGSADNHTVYDINNQPVAGFSHITGSNTIGYNIQNPTVHIYNSTLGNNSPFNTMYHNMWDAQTTSTTITAAATIKTVYDPCPPGFCVPNAGLYNYIKSQTKPAWNNGYTYSGVYFPALSNRGAGSGAVNSYTISGGYYWSTTPANEYYIRSFTINSGSWNVANNARGGGYSVRAVAE